MMDWLLIKLGLDLPTFILVVVTGILLGLAHVSRRAWRTRACRAESERDYWRREAAISEHKAVYLSSILHERSIQTSEYGFINSHWMNAARIAAARAATEEDG